MLRRIKESTRHIEAVLKTLEVLDCFQTEPELSLKKLCDITGMNKSRIIRICGTLESRECLIRDATGHGYRLGGKILSLGRVYERSNNLISLARPLLRRLADVTGESATLFVVDGFERLCLAREEGTSSLRFNIIEGQRLPLYAGAGGKILLAFGPEELRRKVRRLKEPNRRTITEALKHLDENLEVIRKQGYALSSGERDPDLAALAVPVYRHDGIVCAAISIAGPINRFSPEHNVKHLEILLATSYQLSQMLGYEVSKPSRSKLTEPRKSQKASVSLTEV